MSRTAASKQRIDDPDEFGNPNRLGQVLLESRLAGARHIGIVAVTGQGHQVQPFIPCKCPQLGSKRITVRIRQTDIEECEVRREFARALRGRRPVGGIAGLETNGAKQLRQRFPRVPVVIDHQDAKGILLR